jgi:hypothetical protein
MRIADMFTEASSRPFPDIEYEAHTTFLRAIGQHNVPVGTGRILSCYSSTLAPEIVARALPAKAQVVPPSSPHCAARVLLVCCHDPASWPAGMTLADRPGRSALPVSIGVITGRTRRTYIPNCYAGVSVCCRTSCGGARFGR